MTLLNVFSPLMGFLLAVQLPGLWALENIRCSAGEYLHGDTCRPCEPRTFMPDNNHQHGSCISCNRPKPGSPEVVLKDCTPTLDTKLGCSHGYYRMERGLPHQWACLKLTDDPTRQEPEPQTRDNSDDPVCCLQTGAGASDEDQSICTAATAQAEQIGDISILCHRGHYLTMSDTGIPSCLPCPGGTFMPDDLHSFQTCQKCAKLEPGPREITVACTSTRDTALTCETGHYRTLPDTEPDTACHPCSICPPDRPFETQTCGTHSDTVCCPDESMQVVKDASGVYQCVTNPEFTRIHTGVCPAGTYLDYDRGLAQCVACGSGSFMPVSNHVNMDCKRCSVAQESLHEVEVAACTAVADTVIVCQEGYYMDNNRDDLAENSVDDRHDDGRCEKCTVCDELQTNQFVGRNCSFDEDTVCCPEPDMIVALNDEGRAQCLSATSSEVIISCSKGYFLKWSPVGKPSCKECPNGTFMDMDNHNLQHCKPCSKVEEFNMETEVAPCTRTSDTLISCADGHYRQRSRHDPLTFAEECTPCRNCSFEQQDKYLARKCQNYTDTACCPENNMNVEDNENETYVCTYPVDNRRGNISGHNVDQARNGSCISGEYPLFRIANTTDVICRSCPVESNTTRNARVLHFCWNGSENDSDSPQHARIPTAVPRQENCRVGEYMYVLQRSPYVKGDILCSWCEDGTFIAEDYHNRTECRPCAACPGKSVSKNCTRTSDTKFMDTLAPGNEHPITTAIFFFVGAVLSTVNGIRILFHHLSRALM